MVLIALLFAGYRLLFISLDIAALSMTSDDDINRAGTWALFVMGILIVMGLWLANRLYTISRRGLRANNGVVLLLAVFGGVLGVAVVDTLLHLVVPTLRIAEQEVAMAILVVSFVLCSCLIFIGMKKYLKKITRGYIE